MNLDVLNGINYPRRDHKLIKTKRLKYKEIGIENVIRYRSHTFIPPNQRQSLGVSQILFLNLSPPT
jgi:hypothetical protein